MLTLDSNVFSIKQVPIKEPIKPVKGSWNNQKKSNSGFWIDGHDYNPDYWPTYHKAVRGGGEALFEMIAFQEANNHSGKHLYMSLAEIFLPDGPLKDKARNGKPDALKKMFPEQQEQAAKEVEYWKQKILKYKSE